MSVIFLLSPQATIKARLSLVVWAIPSLVFMEFGKTSKKIHFSQAREMHVMVRKLGYTVFPLPEHRVLCVVQYPRRDVRTFQHMVSSSLLCWVISGSLERSEATIRT